jgi:hypothetical protein
VAVAALCVLSISAVSGALPGDEAAGLGVKGVNTGITEGTGAGGQLPRPNPAVPAVGPGPVAGGLMWTTTRTHTGRACATYLQGGGSYRRTSS